MQPFYVLIVGAAALAAALPSKPYARAVLCQAVADAVQATDERAQQAGRAIAFELESYVKAGKKRRKTILNDVADAAVEVDQLDEAAREAKWTQCLDAYAPKNPA